MEKWKPGGWKSSEGRNASGRGSLKSDFVKKAGRPKKLCPEMAAELKRIYFSEPYSLRELAEMFEVSRMTVWRVTNCAKEV